MIVLTQMEGDHFRWRPSLSFWCLIAISAVYLSAAAVYAVLVFRRKRLVIRRNEVRSYGALFIRAIRFADVIEARWLWQMARERPYGLRLHTATKKLVIYFSHFVQREAQGELIDSFRERLGPAARHDWESYQTVREGCASPWSPPVFTIKRMWRMLAVAMGLAMITGTAIGFFLQIRIPDAAVLWAGDGGWTWSGWLPLDWGVGSGLLGLVIGLLFLSFFGFLEWAGLKWTTFQGRRSERAISRPPSNAQ
jgi:hypothetical protein